MISLQPYCLLPQDPKFKVAMVLKGQSSALGLTFLFFGFLSLT